MLGEEAGGDKMGSNQLKSTERTDHTGSCITRQPVIVTTSTGRKDLPSWLSPVESFTVLPLDLDMLPSTLQ